MPRNKLDLISYICGTHPYKTSVRQISRPAASAAVQQPATAPAQPATAPYDRLTDNAFSAVQDARLLELKTANPNTSWKDIGAELSKPHWACKNRYKQLIAGAGAEENVREGNREKDKDKEKVGEFELQNTEGWTTDELDLLTHLVYEARDRLWLQVASRFRDITGQDLDPAGLAEMFGVRRLHNY